MKNADADAKRGHTTRVFLKVAILAMAAFTIYEASQLHWRRASLFESDVTGSIGSVP